MTKYTVWLSCWRMLGKRYPAEIAGEIEAEDFPSACKELLGKGIDGYNNFDEKSLSYQGRQLFDNEWDAGAMYRKR